MGEISYNKIFTLPFKDVDERDCVIEIERANYNGEVTELTGAATPFAITIEDEDFLYTPMRMSTATMSIVGSDYLQTLFSTDYRENRVTLLIDGEVKWCGFIEPETYTQDYSKDLFEFEIECDCAMSVLDHIYYKRKDTGFVCLWDIFKECVSESNGRYSHVYVPHVYASSSAQYTEWENPLEKMLISEQNFFDEDGNAMTLYEVLEEIMKLMNWTCTEWNGDIYLVDMDNSSGEYYAYNADFSDYERVSKDEAVIQNIGFAGSDHTLDILPGYSRATIRCSNYVIGDLIESDSDNLQKWGEDFTEYGGAFGNVPSRIQTFKPGVVDTVMYQQDMEGNWNEITNWDGEEDYRQAGFIYGATNMNYCTYTITDGKPSITDYNFESAIRLMSPTSVTGDLQKFPIIRIKGASAVYTDGVFSINFSMKLGTGMDKYDSSKIWAPEMLEDLKRYYDGFIFPYTLRIGDHYAYESGGDIRPGETTGTTKWEWRQERKVNYFRLNFGDMGKKGKNAYLNSWFPLESNRQLDDGYSGIEGMVIGVDKNTLLYGDLELIIYPALFLSKESETGQTYIGTRNHIKDLQFTFDSIPALNSEESNSDRYYENVVNSEYINELDEIEMKISSYNNDGACYSKVLFNGKYLTKNLYNGITGTMIRPEEFLIRRIVSRYSATHIKLTEVIKRGIIKPYTLLTDQYMPDKRFIVTGGEIDIKNNTFSAIMQEI